MERMVKWCVVVAMKQMFFEKQWGHIVLDEMQEICKLTTAIAKTCDRLQCSHHWMLSGTPLFEGIKDLCGELNFLHLEPFSSDSKDGFFDFMVARLWQEHKPIAIEALKVLSAVSLHFRSEATGSQICAGAAIEFGMGHLQVMLPLATRGM
jgi:SNF2-related domain